MNASYDEYPRIEEAFQHFLDTSLNPRGPDSLFDIVRSLDLRAGSTAVDVGCGEGGEAVELARRCALRVRGIDPVQRNIEVARALVHVEGLDDVVQFEPGLAEALPIADGAADFVWCKEVLMFTDLKRAMEEFHRILRPGGVGLVYQVLTGPRMSDAEAAQFWERDLGYGPAHSQRPSDIEAAIAWAGLALQRRDDLGTEWGEYAEEKTGAGGRRLLHAARLLRAPRRYIDEFGEANYRVMLGDCLWHVYRMIGKLHGAAFVFSKPS